jgi:gliding motility-associated-like protein
MKSFLSVVILCLIQFLYTNEAYGHGQQFVMCVDCNTGDVTIWVEHNQGEFASPANATIDFKITIDGVPSTSTVFPDDLVSSLINVPMNSLPCAGVLTSYWSCSLANSTNDWVSYTFPALPSGVPISIEALVGSWGMVDSGCAGTYPNSTGVFTITPCGGCAITDITTAIVTCTAGPNLYDISGDVTFNTPPLTGTLTVTDCHGNNQVFNAPFTSPLSYSFLGIVADALPCDVTAVFSDDLPCTFTSNYTAPGLDAPPTASNPVATNVECTANIPLPDVLVVIDEADNGGPPVVAFVSEISDGNSCPETITRTYSITDDCGNSVNVFHTIIVNDISPPTASNPVAIVVNCPLDVPVPDALVVTDEADNCTINPVVAFVSDVSDGNSCNTETITRTYSVTDDCGNFTSVFQTITISAVTPAINAGADRTICEGDAVTLLANNPNNASIAWDNGVIDGIAFVPSTGTLTYTVSADVCSGSCSAADQIDITVIAYPTANFTGDNLIGCEPHTVNFSNQSTAQFDCIWDFGDGTVSNSCADQSHIYSGSGLFDVSLTVTNAAGCAMTTTYSDYIEVVNPPQAAFLPSATNLIGGETDVSFLNNSLFASSYSWNFGDATSGSTLENPTHTFPNSSGGSYLTTLYAYNSIGCVDSISQLIQVEDLLIFYVPNIFTPDGDDYNERFTPVFTSGFNLFDFHMTIFNRWGEIVFESYNSASGWNGHYGDGGLSSDAVFVWQIEFAESGTDKKQTVRGHVTVLK